MENKVKKTQSITSLLQIIGDCILWLIGMYSSLSVFHNFIKYKKDAPKIDFKVYSL